MWAALEKDISKENRAEMLRFFESSCAYCGLPLTSRWHADHLVAVDAGGVNHLSNRVPSCPRCNEQEKRELPWDSYLRFKCAEDANLFAERKSRIEAWNAKHATAHVPISAEMRAAWKEEVDILAAAIDASWKRLRDLSRKQD